MVWPPEEHAGQGLVRGRAGELGHRAVRIPVPANRIGATALSLAQLKIMQEVITLLVFIPFVVLYMKQPIKLDYLWAALCMLGAVYFIFRS